MKEYTKNLLSNSKTASSKRFISLYSLGLLTVVVIAILFGLVIPEALIYSLVGLITGTSALTVFQPSKAQYDENK